MILVIKKSVVNLIKILVMNFVIILVGGLTFNGEILKVKILMGAPSNPIPLAKRSSEQFLFLKLDIWKALM